MVATLHAPSACTYGGGFDASVQDEQGNLIAVTGNPASGDPNPGVGAPILPPNVPTNVASLGWSNPCSAGPVHLNVSFHDSRYGSGAPLLLPQQACADGPMSTSHFQIEPAS